MKVKAEGQMFLGVNSNSFVYPKHFIFLDYDNKSREEVKKDILKLRKKYGDLIDNIDIYKSSFKSYHSTIWKESVSTEMLYEVVLSSKSDKKFKNCMLYNRFCTLRATSKIKGNKIYRIKLVESIDFEDNFNPYRLKYRKFIKKVN